MNSSFRSHYKHAFLLEEFFTLQVKSEHFQVMVWEFRKNKTFNQKRSCSYDLKIYEGVMGWVYFRLFFNGGEVNLVEKSHEENTEIYWFKIFSSAARFLKYNM